METSRLPTLGISSTDISGGYSNPPLDPIKKSNQTRNTTRPWEKRYPDHIRKRKERGRASLRLHRVTMRGIIPTTVALVAAKKLGAKKAELIRHATSGDVQGYFLYSKLNKVLIIGCPFPGQGVTFFSTAKRK
jgi:AmmeMemoRadiSam system protein B